MRQIFISFLCILSVQQVFSQYPVGQTSTEFYDESRDRQIETVIYYPAETGGIDDEVAFGEFPVIAIGHGFGISINSYEYLWEHLVPEGYIIALPNTENSIFSVSHEDFGLDLAFVIESLKDEGSTETSLFYNHVFHTSSIIGHSMGGGAAVLGAAAYDSLTTLVTLAAAETSPSAIEAALSTEVSSLTFAGAEDCVTPPAEHQQPIYDNLNDCKSYITITGGSHCQFSNSNSFCELGEVTCDQSNFISETLQHSIVTSLITPWFGAWLKGNPEDWETYLQLIEEYENYEVQTACTLNPPFPATYINPNLSHDKITLYPVPSNNHIFIKGLYSSKINYQILNSKGHILEESILKTPSISIHELSSGIYFLKIRNRNKLNVLKFIKL